ncbi:MAG: translation initiation factor IF-2 subunit beta [Halobacteriaceae archaeon]
MDYDDALSRAHTAMPDRPSASESRLSIPDPAGETDGAFTRLTNLAAIAEAVGRDPEHLHRSLQRQFGTNGQFDGDRARYNGSFGVDDFEAAIDAYVAEYVTCGECGLPDTRLVREDGIDMLRCEACGAFRPVAADTVDTSSADRPTLEEGATVEVTITGTGRKGDGVAERGKYTIFVSGAREGETVQAYIDSINGTLAFARKA